MSELAGAPAWPTSKAIMPVAAPVAVGPEVQADAAEEGGTVLDSTVPVEWLWVYLRKQQRENYFWKLIVYILFIALFTAITQMIRPPHSTFAVHDAIMQHTARDAFPGATWEKTFYDVSNDAEWWEWVETVLLPNILDDTYYNGDLRSKSWGARFANTVGMYNTQTSPVRFRQARVTDDSCDTAGENSALARPCWGTFRIDRQYKQAFGESYGNRYLTGLNGISGKAGFGEDYGTEGHVVDMALNKALALDKSSKMKQGLWLNEQTRAVSIETSWYNANLDLSTYCRWHMDISPGGRFQPYVLIFSCRLNAYSTPVDYIRAILEVIFIVLLGVYWVIEIYEIFLAEKKDYFRNFWNWLELFNLALFVIITVWWYAYVGLDKTPFQTLSNDTYDQRPDLSGTAQMFNVASHLAAFNMVFSYVKLFKYLQFYPSLSMLWRTLEKAMGDILPFLIVFVLFTCGFTFAGHWIFGYMMVEFHSWWDSFCTLLQAMIGGLPYHDMKLFAPVSAAIFTFAWIGMMVLVLVNMFVAFLTEWYLQVNAESISEVRRLQEKVGQNAQITFFQGLYRTLRGKFKGGPVEEGTKTIFDMDKKNDAILKLMKQGDFRNSEDIRRALVSGKGMSPMELAKNFRGDENKAFDFVRMLRDMAGADVGPEPDQELQEQVQLQKLRETVERLEGHLRNLRGALNETRIAPLKEGQSLTGYYVEPGAIPISLPGAVPS